MGSLDGKIGLIVGVANKRSLAWAIAQAAAARGRAAGAHLPGAVQGAHRGAGGDARRRRRCCCSATCRTTRRSTPSSPGSPRAGGLDFLVHGVAFASRDDLSNPFTDTSREGFKTALDVSAYSLIALARGARPLFEARGGGSIVTLSFLGSDRVFPNYNVMGVAKAALEVDGALPGGRPRPARTSASTRCRPAR